MTRTRLVLVRHGQTDFNATGRFQGQLDMPLNEHGLEQVREVAPVLAGFAPGRVVTSDLRRARATADVIGEACGLPVEVDGGLREIHVGSWEGLTPEEVIPDAPWFEEYLRNGRDFRRSGTGETASEAGERVAAVLARLGEEHPGETSLVVGHGLALRVGLAMFLGLGFKGSVPLSGLWNCSWTVLEQRERWRLTSYNNVVAGHSGPLASPSSR